MSQLSKYFPVLFGSNRVRLPFSDNFNRADGLLGGKWYAPTWDIVSNAVTNTPITFGSNVIVNGGFDTDSDWTKGTGWSISGGVASHIGALGYLDQSPLAVDKLYKFIYTSSGEAGGSFFYAGNFAQDLPTNNTYTVFAFSLGFSQIRFRNDNTLTVDDVSAVQATLSEYFASLPFNTADVAISITSPQWGPSVSGFVYPQGLVACLDNKDNPQNFILAMIGGMTSSAAKMRLYKCVNGVYTLLINVTVTPTATKALRLEKNGTSVKVYFDGVQLGTTQTVSDASIINNKRHGLFNCGGSLNLDDFSATVPT